ncbi:dipeptide/oligopeptide/nickel ABC transporter permease/ATP-binding protein [Actinoplanes sp. NPDC024001]|uniref:dipeptide/oligopeptide/nickel ABC transporter permease/ATP-binding protein n=1 Tax=Actinoplanes sp. NPDC024001 TaxID=3154598 RepID=UPI0033E9886C
MARTSLKSRLALALLVLVAAGAAAAPLFAADPLATGIPALPPSAEHWFGTDRAGRDVFARVLYGARYSLAIGLGATALAVLAGAVIGAFAATSRRWADETSMRLLDVVMAFPGIALAAVLVTVFGTSVPVLIGTIAFLYVPSIARVVRANVMAQYGEDYVAAEKVIGASRWHILIRHVTINCAAPVLVFATVLVADAIVFEASLSFISAGVQDPEPSWGNVMSYGRQILFSGGWWATFFPGMAILLTVLALNVLAEGLTDTWAAPRSAVRRKGVTATEPPAAPVAVASAEGDLERSLGLLAASVRRRGPAVPPLADDAPPLLQVRDLSIRFPQRHGDVAVVEKVSFDVRVGETLGLVGESGCGKSLTSLAVTGLLPRGAQVDGQILFDGEDLLGMPARRRRALAGPGIAMVYQDALSSLNPSVLVGTQLKQLTSRGGTRTPAELLELVNLSPERTLKSYPHELSGGQRQRVLIAMALSRSPRLLIADEPTTALDVTVQAQVVDLLVRLRDELGFAMVLVSHDLGLVGELSHRIAVMYAGQVAETGVAGDLLQGPRHHYARGLLGSVLSLEAGAPRLHQIPGVVPAPRDFAAGCRFASRCAFADDTCREVRPPTAGSAWTHAYACHHPALVRDVEGVHQ